MSPHDQTDDQDTDKTTKVAKADKQLTVSVSVLKRVGALIASLAVLGALVWGGWTLVNTKRDLAAFDESKTAASDFVTTYFTTIMTEGQSADGVRAAILDSTTGAMHDRVEKDSQAAVDFARNQRISNFTAEVTSAAVQSFDRSNAVVIVSAQFVATSIEAPAGAKNLVLLQVDLTEIDGRWLVENIDAAPGAGAGTESPLPGAGGAVPTAPAPASVPAVPPTPAG